MEERLQKILARAGIGSRRECEKYIEQGRVTVNGVVATIGMKANPRKDDIRFDGKHIRAAEPLRYVALYKPPNVISAVHSPDPRPTVRDLVPLGERLYPVGRLDIESEGLILLTNDGELTNLLTHPRYGVEKEYRVLLPRRPDEKQLAAWRHGVVLPDGHRTAPARVRIESQGARGTWVRVIMHEGRKRQIREIGEQLGLPVLRLIRVRIGNLQLGKLKRGKWRELTPREVSALKRLARAKKRPRPAKKPRRDGP